MGLIFFIYIIDNYAIYNMEISTYDLMLEAGKTIHRFIHEYFPSIKKIVLFCGVGNNGGDGLLIGQSLKELGHSIEIYSPFGCGKKLSLLTVIQKQPKRL